MDEVFSMCLTIEEALFLAFLPLGSAILAVGAYGMWWVLKLGVIRLYELIVGTGGNNR